MLVFPAEERIEALFLHDMGSACYKYYNYGTFLLLAELQTQYLCWSATDRYTIWRKFPGRSRAKWGENFIQKASVSQPRMSSPPRYELKVNVQSRPAGCTEHPNASARSYPHMAAGTDCRPEETSSNWRPGGPHHDCCPLLSMMWPHETRTQEGRASHRLVPHTPCNLCSSTQDTGRRRRLGHQSWWETPACRSGPGSEVHPHGFHYCHMGGHCAPLCGLHSLQLNKRCDECY